MSFTCPLVRDFFLSFFLLFGCSGGVRGGVDLCDARVCQKLPVGTTEDAPRVGRDVDTGDLLSGLSSARGGGVEACFHGVVLGG